MEKTEPTKTTPVQRIGITFDVPTDENGIFSNGIRQNALAFYELLALIGYEVRLVVVDEAARERILVPFWNQDGNFHVVLIDQMLDYRFDLVVQFGFDLPDNSFELLKQHGTKIVFYNCGNLYFIESESCLFRPDDQQVTKYHRKRKFDQIWLIPQMMNSCKHYMETLYRCEVLEAPFVWSPNYLELSEKYNDQSFLYQNRGPSKAVTIFEPNISLMKWCLPAVLICENAYRTLKERSDAAERDRIRHLFVTNVPNNIKNIKRFTYVVNSLDLHADKRISIESRYHTLLYMANFADVAVSHQMENNLNYLYLDLAWMGWPVVHNASLCPDIGYYYEGFDYGQGGDLLVRVLETHDSNKDEYLERNRTAINRFLPSNLLLQSRYKRMIDRLFSGN